MKQKQKNETSVMNVIISLYLFIMLGIFPLYYKYQYADMGDEKYKIFLYSSSFCVVMVFVCFLCHKLFFDRKSKQTFKTQQSKASYKKKGRELTKLDIAVLIYFICTTISFLLSPFKETGFWGADGWSMGYLSQALFVAIYFILAKGWRCQKWAMRLLGVSSALVFLVAVFHRFDIDLLQIYGNLDLRYKVLFLSTMGQSSWYSSFLCTVYPIGLYLFFSSEDKKTRMAAGFYSVLAMFTLVTQNTDSAFLSLFAVMVVLLYLSFDRKATGFSKQKAGKILQQKSQHKQLLEVMILILASFCFMGLCQRIFADRVIPLDTMSLFMSQNILIWILLVGALLLYCIVVWKNKRDKNRTPGNLANAELSGSGCAVLKVSRTPFWIFLALTGAVVFAIIIFIILNTNGSLLEKFGYQSTNNYLLFDDQWGNGRGFSWKFAVSSFAEFSFLQKLFGVGPDCFSAYAASVPEYLEKMKGFWGDLVLTNAHNEYLTKLYDVGIAGLLAYVGMLVTAFVTFIKNRNVNPALPAFALCVVSYMAHNIFCYEQVCCTPIFYILMGIGSNLAHNTDRMSTY